MNRFNAISRLAMGLAVLCLVASCTTKDQAPGVAPPVTYSGEIPCADCPGNLITLTLRADSLFLMRQVYRKALDGLDKAFVEWGRWTRDRETGHILLTGGEFLQKYAIVDAEHIRMLDQYGQPIESDLNYTLTKSETVDAFPDTLRMSGRYFHFADAGLYWDCRFEKRFPVALQGDNRILESAYSQNRTHPMDTVLISIDGHLDSLPARDREGLEERLVVDRLVGIWPEVTCESPRPPTTLDYTVWEVIGIGDRFVHVDLGQRPPHLRFLPTDSMVVGYTGCNNFRGSVQYGGGRMAISPTVLTRMACPPGVLLEAELLRALEAVDSYIQSGDTLHLRSGNTEWVRLVAKW
ncbi:MAG: hypothetical protein Kow0074_26100 [Candidatus Zixiibacteriota bacterium]